MQLTIVLPDDLGERVRRLPDPNRFITDLLSKALGRREMASRASQTSEAPRRILPRTDRPRWLANMRSALGVEGPTLAIEEIQAMSRETDLEENELSRSVIEARER